MATVGRRALECEEETALTTTLEPTAPDAREASGRGCTGKKCAMTCCFLVLALLLFIGIVIGINNSQRSRLLEPILDMLTQIPFCHEPARGTCVAEIPAPNLEKFDLHPPQPEKALMGFMYMQVAQQQREIMREIFSGAHLVLLKDQVDSTRGPISAYEMLGHWPGAYKRASSHRSDAQQYGIPQGQVLHTILLGEIGGKTWFQFEGNGVDGVWTFLLHMCDYVEYKLTGRNIGPLGTSKYTDRSPLLIHLPVAMKKQECPLMCNHTGLDVTNQVAHAGAWLRLLRSWS